MVGFDWIVRTLIEDVDRRWQLLVDDARVGVRSVGGALLRSWVGCSEQTGPVTVRCSSAFAGFCFPREVIAVAVRWYLRYSLSHRDVEELLCQRGISVDHLTVYRCVQRFTAEFIEAARRAGGCG